MTRSLRAACNVAPFIVLAIAACSGNEVVAGNTGDPEQQEDEHSAPAEPPAVFSKHGQIYLPGGQLAEPSVEFVESAQAYYLYRLAGELEPADRAAFEEEKKLALAEDTPEHRIAANKALIDWLIATVKPRDATMLDSVNRALLQLVPGGVPVAEISSTRQAFTTTTSAAGQAYVDECRAAGVPIPPTWGSTAWGESRGDLTTDFQGGGNGEVFTFESTSPRGICIALPRWSGDVALFLGIVCQGNDTSKACFWDDRVNSRIQKGEEHAIVGPKFVGGADLVSNRADVCSDCHAGENAFIVHPGTPLDRGPILRANGWVNPLVAPQWPQNRKPGYDLERVLLGQGDASCLDCHNEALHNRFPNLAGLSEYCEDVAGKAVTATMPPSDPGNAAYDDHADEIRTGCRPALRPATRFGAPAKWHELFSLDGEQPGVGDFNNDGVADIITFVFGAASDVWVALSNRSGFNSSSKWHDNFVGNSLGVRVGDFNGDGKDDIMHVFNSNTRIDAALSGGASFGAKRAWWSRATPIFGQFEVGDVNNDGKDDVIVLAARTTAGVTSTEVHVMLSTGSAFSDPVRFHSTFYEPNVVYRVGDVNGDGFADLVKFKRGASRDVFVALSKRTSFGAATKWHDSFALDGETPRVGDITGDGIADVITILPDGRVYAAVSNGKDAFVGTGLRWHSDLPAGATFIGDTTGDGDGELITFTHDAAADVFVSRALE